MTCYMILLELLLINNKWKEWLRPYQVIYENTLVESGFGKYIGIKEFWKRSIYLI
jgi:hypothetical protein